MYYCERKRKVKTGEAGNGASVVVYGSEVKTFVGGASACVPQWSTGCQQLVFHLLSVASAEFQYALSVQGTSTSC